MSLIETTQQYLSETITSEFQTVAFVYLAWSTAHHITPHIYTYLCTPNTLWGIVSSPLVASAPHCTAMRWIIYEGGNTIHTMWMSIGGYVGAKVLLKNFS